jgi:hypothetical protein
MIYLKVEYFLLGTNLIISWLLTYIYEMTHFEESWTSANFNTFDPIKYFTENGYDYFRAVTKNEYEKYDDAEMLNENFDKNGKVYYVKKYTISNSSNNVNNVHRDCKKYFIVAVEDVPEEELKLLKKYCQCRYHLTTKLWPFFPCSCCVGCCDTPFPEQYVIKETRKYIKSLQQYPNWEEMGRLDKLRRFKNRNDFIIKCCFLLVCFFVIVLGIVLKKMLF